MNKIGKETYPVEDNKNFKSYDNPGCPSLPYHSQTPSLTLRVQYQSWMRNEVRIRDVNNTATLYNVNIQLSNPHITVHSTSKAAVGTVVLPFLSSTIKTTVHDSQITLTSKGLLKNGHKWSSPSLGKIDITWKTQKNLDLVCLDAQGVKLALFSFPNWSLRESGTLELFGSEMVEALVVEEILVTGMAMIEYTWA
jgi:hypothetical protein